LLFHGSDPEARGLLAARAQGLRPALTVLGDAEARGELTATRANLALQFNHMTLNRLFHSDQRAQEFVLYDFLARLYRTRQARGARAVPALVPSRDPGAESAAHQA